MNLNGDEVKNLKPRIEPRIFPGLGGLCLASVMLGLVFLLLSGCGESTNSGDKLSLDSRLDDSYNNGYLDALECVERHGESVDDAVYYCKRY